MGNRLWYVFGKVNLIHLEEKTFGLNQLYFASLMLVKCINTLTAGDSKWHQISISHAFDVIL